MLYRGVVLGAVPTHRVRLRERRWRLYYRSNMRSPSILRLVVDVIHLFITSGMGPITHIIITTISDVSLASGWDKANTNTTEGLIVIFF